MSADNWTAVAALVISGASLAISLLSLGWSVYKEVHLRARVRVRCAVMEIIDSTGPLETSVIISCGNHGPGSVKIKLIGGTAIKYTEGTVATANFVLMHDRNHPQSSELPTTLEVGDEATYIIPYSADVFLKLDLRSLYVADSFGRRHYAPMANIREARAHYLKDFVASEGAGDVKHGEH